MCTLQTKNILSFSRMVLGVFVLTSLLGVQYSKAQSDFLSSQYMHSQMLINPAYAGVPNSLNIDVLSRQQWMGIKGAPTTYMLSAHSPLNKTMASIGGSFMHFKNGPIQHNQITMAYSYLIKLSDRMFLSMGLSAQVNSFNINLTSLDVIEDGDPGFAQNFKYSIKPNGGVGAYLYSPQFYLGVSMPQALVMELNSEDAEIAALRQMRNFYLTSAYAFNVGDDFELKPSFLARFRQGGNSAVDVNMQLQYQSAFGLGCSYRINNSMAALFNVQISKSIGLCYSYDFPIHNKTTWGVGSHEISISIHTSEYLKRNRDRLFGKKKKATKKTDNEGSGVRSMRYF